MKILIPCLLLLFVCCEKEKNDKNNLSVTVYNSDSISKYYSRTNNYFLKIELVTSYSDTYYNNLSTYKTILYDSIKTLQPFEIKNLCFGAFLITAFKNDKKATNFIIYKGGSTQLNLLLQ